MKKPSSRSWTQPLCSMFRVLALTAAAAFLLPPEAISHARGSTAEASAAESYEAAPPASNPSQPNRQQLLAERRQLFARVETLTGIPWTLLAAVDQYERTMSLPRKRPARTTLIGIDIPDETWAGITNPNPQDTDPHTISLFQGMGKDGDGDGRAEHKSDLDTLYTMAAYLNSMGQTDEDRRIALWEYYHNTRSIERISQFARMYQTYDTLDLFAHTFPLPLRSNYSYRSTWGDSRGWGGRRIHEGTDIFAGHGVPVRSCTYGVIEVMGWNPYGGWRVGIWDINNVYHYFAHLSGFNKQVKRGDLVKPGQVIGWVGSSGYGKPGTSGKFPPHLHYGLYRDNGWNEWSFDPYPYLRRWEKEERARLSSKS